MDSKYVCKTRPEFVLSSAQKRNIGPIQCFFINFSATLHEIHFSAICCLGLGLIMLISIFGRIKGNYRWFIFNQVVWDFLISFDTNCDSIVNYLDNNYKPSCFYASWDNRSLKAFYFNILNSNVYTALLLLSFSRFVALYFLNFYDKLTKNHRILYLILAYNLIMIFLSTYIFIYDLQSSRRIYRRQICLNNKNCDPEDDFLLKALEALSTILYIIMDLKPTISLLLSFIAAIFIILKISKQFKFQLKHNRRDFFISIRIAAVILFQNFINLWILFIRIINNESDSWLGYFPFLKDAKTSLQKILPSWFTGSYSLTSDAIIQMIVQIRIFIEILVILFIMAGYREAIFNAFKILYLRGKNVFSQIKVSSRIEGNSNITVF